MTTSPRIKPNKGFTLTELLVVIAIIAVLAALSTTVIIKSMAKSRTTESINNLKQLHIAAVSFAEDNYGIYPATYWGEPGSGNGKVYWWSALGPYVYNNYNGKLDATFRDRADPRAGKFAKDDFRTPKWTEISYTPWGNGTTGSRSAVKGISIDRTRNSAGQPYLTTGENTGTWAVANEAAYNKYVQPSADWRDGEIIVLYCNGSIRSVKSATFEKVAPSLADDD